MSVKRIVQLSLIVILALSSLAVTSRAQAWSYCGATYVVQRGDWLSKIARNCGTTLSALYAANPWLYSFYYIYPGQVLVMPGGYQDPNDGGGPGALCGPASDIYGSLWVVCRGDTLGRIAQYYGLSWRYLQSRNNIPNPNLIYVGQIIRP